MNPGRVSALAADFGRATACFRCGDRDGVLVVLLPLGLSEGELAERARRLVVIGALLVSCQRSEGEDVTSAGVVADVLTTAAAERDPETIRDVLSTCRASEVVDVLVELVARFAATAGQPLVKPAPRVLPGAGPFPSRRGGSL